jgi:CubicO group peptidase (beta-lactamase class C family)
MPTTLPEPGLLHRRLTELAAEHGVPGAVAGVLSGDEQVICATGVTRLPDGPPMTSDTLFLIASITKVWTATLVMQLVDAGEVNLDPPVNDYLDPPLRLADPALADTVTVRHLLTHSGGFLGDFDEPPDRGDDAVRDTVATYGALGAVHRPGRLFSYANTGYNVLGRLVECRTGQTWDAALRERIIDPLGLTRTFTLPEEAAVHRLAVGHDPKGPDTLELEPVRVWLDPRGSGPCGGTLATTAADLLAFARMHMADGAGPGGRRVLSPESARAMREPQITQPDPSMSPHWGLGWGVERAARPTVVEHAGHTAGQHSHLVAVPEHGLALCVLANGDSQGLLRRELTGWLMRELLGMERPRTPEPAAPADPVDVKPFVGSYDAGEIRIDVTEADGALHADFVTTGRPAARHPGFSAPFTYAGGTTFVFTMPPLTIPIAATFLDEDGDGPAATHLAVSLRAAPRLSTP